MTAARPTSGVGRRRQPSGLLVALLAAVLVLVPVAGGRSHPAQAADERNGDGTPVVLIVLDELPTASLMTRNGLKIDARRFPGIAAFASGATWYRDNMTVGDFTAWAVPSILSGQVGDLDLLPTSAGYPQNIFTLLGPGRNVNVLEPLTELCPVSICPGGGQGQVTGVDNAVDFIKAKFHPFDPATLQGWIDAIPPGEGSLSVLHLISPHFPFRYTPEGKTYVAGHLGMPTDLNLDGWTVGEFGVSFVQQRHLIQLGYTDLMVGRILDRIRQNGDFDRAMIVLTADHGLSFDPAGLRRNATPGNVGATVNPPLIIKFPGQTQGEVSNVATRSTDILPTVAATIGAVVPAADGLPVDEIPPDRQTTVSRFLVSPLVTTAGQVRQGRSRVLAAQFRRLGDRGLWQLGPRSFLIGKRPGKTPFDSRSRYRLDQRKARIRQADASDGSVPALISGQLAGLAPGRLLALAWNGRIVATTRAFSYQGRIQFGAMVPPAVMRRGQNRITLYVGGPGGGLLRVHPS